MEFGMDGEVISTLGKSWRVVIPAEVRKKLDLKEHDDLVFQIGENGVRLTSRHQRALEALARMHAYYKDNKPYCSSDELLAWRREEYRKEMKEMDKE